jgi:hypothetical protein
MIFGNGQLVGWELTVPPGAQRERGTARSHLLQVIYLSAEDRLEAVHRHLRHALKDGRSMLEHLIEGLLDLDALAAADDRDGALYREARLAGFTLLTPALERRMLEEEKRVGSNAGQALEDGRWLVYSFQNGHLLAFERHLGMPCMWREATAEYQAREEHKRAASAAERAKKISEAGGAAAPSPHAAGEVPAAPSTADAAAAPAAPATGPSSSPEGPGLHEPQGVPAAATPVAGPASGSSTPAPAGGPPAPGGSPDAAAAVAETRAAVAGPMAADVTAALAEMRRRQLERQREAAGAALGTDERVRTLWESMKHGGSRRAPTPGIMCASCGKSLSSYDGLAHQDDAGLFQWAHPACVDRELAEQRGPFGSVPDMREKLAALGVALRGDEGLLELEAALFQARRADATQVEWAAKKPKKARTEKKCALCPAPIAKGDLYRDGGNGRVAHDRCTALVAKEAA